MLQIPKWLRVAMGATAVMNLVGCLAFIPAARALRAWGGLPVDSHPLYLATIGAFILVFGIAYLWIAVTGRAEKLFVAVAAGGKLSFFGLLVVFWLAGMLPAQAVASGVGDLVFGGLFLAWLFTARK